MGYCLIHAISDYIYSHMKGKTYTNLFKHLYIIPKSTQYIELDKACECSTATFANTQIFVRLGILPRKLMTTWNI